MQNTLSLFKLHYLTHHFSLYRLLGAFNIIVFTVIMLDNVFSHITAIIADFVTQRLHIFAETFSILT